MEFVENLSQYQCHKVVGAFRIAEIVSFEGGTTLKSKRNNPDHKVTVSSEWAEKCQPVVGGFFVQDEDGEQSFSPEKPFEDGYTEIKA